MTCYISQKFYNIFKHSIYYRNIKQNLTQNLGTILYQMDSFWDSFAFQMPIERYGGIFYWDPDLETIFLQGLLLLIDWPWMLLIDWLKYSQLTQHLDGGASQLYAYDFLRTVSWLHSGLPADILAPGVNKVPTTWYFSPLTSFFKSWFSSQKFPNPSLFPHEIFFLAALILKERYYPFTFFPRYILPHNHDIPFPSSQLHILHQQTKWGTICIHAWPTFLACRRGSGSGWPGSCPGSLESYTPYQTW